MTMGSATAVSPALVAVNVHVCITYTRPNGRKTRVDFNDPNSLVERADSVVEIPNVSRTRLLIDALEGELEEVAADEEFRRRLSDAYYDGRIGYDTVDAVLGREEALRMELVRESMAVFRYGLKGEAVRFQSGLCPKTTASAAV